jgi:RNA polymerase sigma-70 factor (ECF subfamily)
MPAARREADTSVDPVTWLDDHGDYLFGYAILRVHGREVAEDLVQETLLAGIQRVRSFQERSSVRTWLTGILKHKILDHLRKPASSMVPAAGMDELERWIDGQFTRRGQWKTPPANWARSRVSLAQQASHELEDLRQVVADCLERLPPRALEVLLLVERLSMPAEKVGHVLNASATNIGVLLHRARMAMRRCLEVHWFGRQAGERT